jgi:hypothetical protein
MKKLTLITNQVQQAQIKRLEALGYNVTIIIK